MRRVDRRKFMQQSLALAGASFAISTTQHRVLGANDRIHVGVAGLNGRGGSHIGEFQGMEGVEVTYLIDPDSALFGRRTKDVEGKGGRTPTCVQDVREALEDDDLHVISIATCNHWHSLMTIWACQAGKDVYVEKPMSHNIHEGRIAVETARKHKRIVQHGTQRRGDGHWQTVGDIAAGKRGKLVAVRGFSFKGRGSIGRKEPQEPPTELDFNIWLGPAPEQPYHGNLVHYNWHWFWDTGNGDIGNYGVHEMDMCRWTIPNATLPKSVFSLGGRFLWDDQGQTPNVQFAVYDYGDTKLIFEVSNLRTNRERPTLAFDEEAAAQTIEIETPADVKSPIAERGPGDGVFKNFVACVRSRKSDELDAHALEGHYSSALCHLANISYRLGEDVPFDNKTKSFGGDKEAYRTWEWFQDTLKDNGLKLEETTYRVGRTLQFDAETEKFADDEAANELLTRPPRPPFVVPERVV